MMSNMPYKASLCDVNLVTSSISPSIQDAQEWHAFSFGYGFLPTESVALKQVTILDTVDLSMHRFLAA